MTFIALQRDEGPQKATAVGGGLTPLWIGEGVLVVAFEFNHWQDVQGARQLDRLDVLGLDITGRLVLAELKRDRAPDTVQMQALKYAAMASRFTEDDLAEYHARFLSQRSGRTVSADEARTALSDHAGELDAEVLGRPRIVLVAGGFTATTTATVVWLTEMGLDITLQQVHAYQSPTDGVIVSVSQLFPLKDVEEFTITPQRAAAQHSRSGRGRGELVVNAIIDRDLVADGTPFSLSPTTEVSAPVRDAVLAWVAEDERRGRATWVNDPRAPLRWEFDGEQYKPTTIVRFALEAAGSDRSAAGPRWWVDERGASLATIAQVGGRIVGGGEAPGPTAT